MRRVVTRLNSLRFARRILGAKIASLPCYVIALFVGLCLLGLWSSWRPPGKVAPEPIGQVGNVDSDIETGDKGENSNPEENVTIHPIERGKDYRYTKRRDNFVTQRTESENVKIVAKEIEKVYASKSESENVYIYKTAGTTVDFNTREQNLVDDTIVKENVNVETPTEREDVNVHATKREDVNVHATKREDVNVLATKREDVNVLATKRGDNELSTTATTNSSYVIMQTTMTTRKGETVNSYTKRMEDLHMHTAKKDNITLHPNESRNVNIHPKERQNANIHQTEGQNINIHPKEHKNANIHPTEGQNINIHPKEHKNANIHPTEGQNVTIRPTEGQNVSIRPTVGQNVNIRPTEGPIICHAPDLDPFDPKIIHFFHRHGPLDCTGNSPGIVDVIGQELRVNPDKVKHKLGLDGVDGCKYRNIHKLLDTDYHLVLGHWSELFNNTHIRDDEEFLQIMCVHKQRLVSTSYKALVRNKPKIEVARTENYRKHVLLNAPKETLSILIVGMDGMSRANIIRCLPKTKQYILNEMGAIEFNNFNKVGANTFPNAFGLLSGKKVEEVTDWDTSQPFDDYKHLFVWDQYEKAGYRTAAMFDTALMSMFHYLREGWNKPPTDYYPRPVFLRSEFDEFDYRKTNINCMGDTPEVTQLLDYWIQLTSLYNNTATKPYFAYSFLTRLSHDDENLACAGDELYLEFFQSLKNKKVLNNTVLIFFSDHGPRFGPGIYTYNKLYETKTPMLFVMFPSWLERKYPDIIKNFRANRNRLVTVFDLHATLVDLLYFTGQPKPSNPTTRGISLFSQIPTNRTCEDAGIPFKFCACTQLSPHNMADTKVAATLAQYMVRWIVYATRRHRDKCLELTLQRIISVYVLHQEQIHHPAHAFYHVTLQTQPGQGIYEASVVQNTRTKEVSIMGDVSRLNMYRGQAECVGDSFLRLFCYCSNLNQINGY